MPERSGPEIPGGGTGSPDEIEEPDYSSYTLAELRDVRAHLDTDRYPARAARVEKEIARRMAHPGRYEPAAGAAAPDWWPRHWPLALGIAGVVLGLLGVVSHAGGMAAVFNARPAAGPPGGPAAASAEAAPGDPDGAPPAGEAPDEAEGTAGEGTSEDPQAAGEASGEAQEREPAGPAESSSGGETAGEDAGGPGGEGAGPGGRGPGGGGSASMIWLMPTAAAAVPEEAPRWFLAWSAGARFGGVLISLVVLFGGVLLARRREAGTFYLVTGLAMAMALNFLEQGMRISAGLGGAALAAGGLALGLLWNGTLVALVRAGSREALR